MSTDQEFWEGVVTPASRVLLQLALTKPEIRQAIAGQGRSASEFAAEFAADLADRLLIERNRRMGGPLTAAETLAKALMEEQP